jgi:hypothetical protein
MPLDTSPTLGGFITFLRNVAQISTANLPDNTPVIEIAFDVAMLIVNQQLNLASASIYTLAVYNLATSNLLTYAPDPAGPYGPPPAAQENYFSDIRKKWNVLDFIPGVIQSSNDNGTGESMVVIEAAKDFTLANLQQLKDPYGRQYIAFAQSVGTLWGLT